MSEARDPCPRAAGADAAGRHDGRVLSDGHADGLEALEALDLVRVRSADELVRAMSRTAFGGRSLGEAADVLEAMVRDPECFVVLTLSGAMTIAKMGLVVCEMIDRGWVQAVVSTGALMAHGFVEATGRTHFKYDPSMGDEDLFARGYDRVYDTLELEQSLDDVERIVRGVLEAQPDGWTFGSKDLHAALGRWLAGHTTGRGILRSAHEQGVPVYVPAFTDSELGLDVAIFQRRRRMQGRTPPRFDAFLDLDDYTARIVAAPRCGILTIGGGVPRNWAQQVAPYLEITKARLGVDVPLRRFRYGVRVCPEPVHFGGLSGCTYSEGVSWGKFEAPRDGGRFAEVHADATIAWPLLARALLERFEAEAPPPKAFERLPLA